jgi:hypothetical protein
MENSLGKKFLPSLFLGILLLCCGRPDCSVKVPNASTEMQIWFNRDISDLGWLTGNKGYEPYRGGALYIQKMDVGIMDKKSCEICLKAMENEISPIITSAFHNNITAFKIVDQEQDARYIAYLKICQIRTYPILGLLPGKFGFLEDDYAYWFKIVDKINGITVFSAKYKYISFDKKTNELNFQYLAKEINHWAGKL